MYRSILSHHGHGWTMAPDTQGAIKALVPYSLHSLLGAYAARDCICSGTLEQLEELQLHLGSLHRGIQNRQSIRSTPISVEFATHWSQSQEPPMTVSVSSTMASLASSVANGYLINDLVAETLVNRPRIPPQWPSHLDSFCDSLDARELYICSVVLVAPGNIHLAPGSAYVSLSIRPTVDWVVPRSCPAWRVVTEAVGSDKTMRMQVDMPAFQSSEMNGLVSLCDSTLIIMDTNFWLRNRGHGAVA
ncbi:hypothetical protein EV421DRAFT_1912398 [Armillaria borealis]|uniref:Uncharacterized protein n=1 Tax=Armillaria borealis TaxID=47425 RepID=A0AA39MEK3_9AGAR|nr:hypothetical protein EV421DRAFT_1912398 [Armillaria borealis]